MLNALKSSRRWLTLLPLVLALAAGAVLLCSHSVLADHKPGHTKGGNGGGDDGGDEEPSPDLPSYQIEFIDVLDGTGVHCTQWNGCGFNNWGDVVGNTEDPDSPGNPEFPFLYTAQNGAVNVNWLIDPDSNWTVFRVFDLNDSRTIAGRAIDELDPDATIVPVRILPPGEDSQYWTVEALGPLPGSARAINNSGDIAGEFYDVGSPAGFPFLWDQTNGVSMIDGTYPEEIDVADEGRQMVTDISERDEYGDVFVTARGSRILDGWWQAVGYRYSTWTNAYVAMEHYDKDGVATSWASGVNTFGDFVGWAWESRSPDWTSGNTATLYVEGVGQMNLGTLADKKDSQFSVATDVNDNLEVVGNYSNGNFVYHPSFDMQDLRALISNLPADFSASLTDLRLNEEGQIWGTTGNQMFILTPESP